ncbi:MAG TPA: hypothetical protein PLB32_14015 [Acidobacteriota bacterium]|nr:hypothetical protein [Acidobacteriota bacterium]
MKKIKNWLLGALSLSVCCLLGISLNTFRLNHFSPHWNNARLTMSGRQIQILPAGEKFLIPSSWVDWHNKFQNNVHLSRAEIYATQNGIGEWDSEYSKVVNSVLPIADCIGQLGGEGWGWSGVSYTDVQLKVFNSKLNPAELQTLCSTKALSVARSLSSNATFQTQTVNTWQKSVIQFDLWFQDYGGTATVEFWIQSAKTGSLIFVFMHANGPECEEVSEILSSMGIIQPVAGLQNSTSNLEDLRKH